MSIKKYFHSFKKMLSLSEYKRRNGHGGHGGHGGYGGAPQNAIYSDTVQDVDSGFDRNKVVGSNVNYNLIVLNNDQDQLQHQAQFIGGHHEAEYIDVDKVFCHHKEVHCKPSEVRKYVYKEMVKKCGRKDKRRCGR